MQARFRGAALWACLLFGLGGSASATTLYNITIQPIQVCKSDGTACANAGQTLYESYGDQIWAQAGINLIFLPFTSVNNDNLWDFQSVDLPGPSASNIIQLYFVPLIDNTTSTYGLGWLGGNGLAVSDVIFSINRYDTIAHELGHNLGLDHYDVINGTSGCDAGENLHLMSSGSCRSIPTSLSDIAPNGLGYDLLNATEIQTAINTGITNGWLTDATVPEPATVLLSLAGLAFIAVRRRRPAASGN